MSKRDEIIMNVLIVYLMIFIQAVSLLIMPVYTVKNLRSARRFARLHHESFVKTLTWDLHKGYAAFSGGTVHDDEPLTSEDASRF